MDEKESLELGEDAEESTEPLFEENRKRYLSDEETEPTEPQSKIQRIEYTNTGGAYPSMDDDIIRVINTSGDCIYLPIKNEQHLHNKKNFKALKSQLLSVPFKELLSSVEEKRYSRLMEAADADFINEEYSIDLMKDGSESLLWADKYSPREYIQLLSDDSVNRSLLSWLKLWDETVFSKPSHLRDTVNIQSGKDPKKTRGRGGERGRGRGGGHVGHKPWEIYDPKTFATNDALDEHRRPKQKIVLLCGPPGIGKTTLAHTVARQCGYNIVEVNASDDRSADVFRKILESSTEMQSVLTSSSKPNCLIIDEIDGAPAAAINVLVDVIKTKNPTRGKKSRPLLSRPVICICNDLYATSLRTLKQLAVVFTVPITVTGKLANRLMDVCRREGISTTTSTLMALCEKTDNDIRTCLNTLQFIHRKRADISLSAVQAMSVGQKDSQRSLLYFWKEVFKLPSAKKYTYIGSGMSSDNDRRSNENVQFNRFWHILSEASSTGEYERVMQGLFENYLNVKIRDPGMAIVAETQDWIMFYQSLSSAMLSSQVFQLMAYMPFVSVVFHFFYAVSVTGYRVQYPHTQFENNQKYQRYSQLVSQLLVDSHPLVKRDIDPYSSAVYFIPTLLDVIRPNLRPVNIQLYTQSEKSLLSDIVNTMISYNLTYIQERTPDGQYTYNLEPDLGDLCQFPGLPQKKQLQYGTKQMLAREIEVAKVKRHAKSEAPTVAAPVKTTPSSKLSIAASVPQRKKVARDFFGRPITKRAREEGEGEAKEAANDSRTSAAVWFKFNEGFSDAIKKTVRMKDLL
ncbi:PREDICTED: chromosome transmission fidelity protein 18 homolog [Amphimedon queenslandica]|uniref:AAA+ ATPase domain-containing protein n=1 Tax=Amphimedon queenslandica TaxID=400682 RepID=A0A1X7VPZ3_AMPQE|nr:PREDICTED: chromosome transmission fidelity protein 18 homolog [Amphimedon queenslandica]|eukprot:XP_019858878.1 PREDICTED: chromosome transmission fidelity protein 18 homolog [Amphimedon queenslandica]